VMGAPTGAGRNRRSPASNPSPRRLWGAPHWTGAGHLHRRVIQRHDDQADCSACAAPEATGAPGLDSANLALAPEDADLTQSAECRS